MRITEKISHAAERKAFETILDNLIQKGQTQDAGQIANDLVNMVQKLHSDVWSENPFRRFICSPTIPTASGPTMSSA